MPTYTVQRKVITWDTCTIEAENPDEAIDLAVEACEWSEADDSFMATEDYWVQNEETNESALRLEHTGWEEWS